MINRLYATFAGKDDRETSLSGNQSTVFECASEDFASLFTAASNARKVITEASIYPPMSGAVYNSFTRQVNAVLVDKSDEQVR